jgi:catalase
MRIRRRVVAGGRNVGTVAVDGKTLVDAIEAVTGTHAGYRAAHAKGASSEGTFTATAAAAGLSRAPHLAGDPVPVQVRFSNGSGNPTLPDGARDGRGMAVKFRLPDGSSTDMIGLTLDRFFVRTPEDFLAFLQARVPDPETGETDMAKVGEFLAAHPEALPAVEQSITAPIPASYLRCRYHGIHAFRWVDGGGTARAVRFRWEPDEGVATIDDADAAGRDADFLRHELDARLGAGPATFTLVVTLAGEGDDPDDPTVPWPEGRDEVVAGRLELTAIPADVAAADALIYDPTNVIDGVECSADPILHARRVAYTESYGRRTAVTG